MHVRTPCRSSVAWFAMRPGSRLRASVGSGGLTRYHEVTRVSRLVGLTAPARSLAPLRARRHLASWCEPPCASCQTDTNVGGDVRCTSLAGPRGSDRLAVSATPSHEVSMTCARAVAAVILSTLAACAPG